MFSVVSEIEKSGIDLKPKKLGALGGGCASSGGNEQETSSRTDVQRCFVG